MKYCIWYRVLLHLFIVTYHVTEGKQSQFRRLIPTNTVNGFAGNYVFSEFLNITSLGRCAIICRKQSCEAFVHDANSNICKLVKNGTYPSTPLPYVFVASQLCHLLVSGSPSGVYSIDVRANRMTEAYCDMETLGGGWTVIQNRYDGSQNFYKNWDDYKIGFGDRRFEYWLGNEIIFLLTSATTYELRIEMENVDGVAKYAAYSAFALASESDKYTLSASGFTGDVRDSFSYHNGSPFSTTDNGASCAHTYHAGWWYKSCHHSNLNGLYRPSNDSIPDAMAWWRFFPSIDIFTSLASSKMMIRPVEL